MGQKLQGIGRDSWTGILLQYQHIIPHYPGITLIRPARIPPPPNLTGDQDADALACWQAYEGVVEHFFPKRGARTRLHSLEELYAQPLRVHRPLDVAARLLFEHNTQPMLWCAFSVRHHLTYGPLRWRAHRPSMAWVYMAKRLNDANSPFVWSGRTHLTEARIELARAHKTLIAKWERMRAALLCEHLATGLTEAKVSSIVRSLLSDREYKTLTHQATRQGLERQAEIDHAIACGEYLWG